MRLVNDISDRSDIKPTPAAAMICGLRGLDVELARLPFLECCMPWTIDVWRWWPYVPDLGSADLSTRPVREEDV